MPHIKHHITYMAHLDKYKWLLYLPTWGPRKAACQAHLELLWEVALACLAVLHWQRCYQFPTIMDGLLHAMFFIQTKKKLLSIYYGPGTSQIKGQNNEWNKDPCLMKATF